MKNKLNKNFKANKMQLELLKKIELLDEFARKGALWIDEGKSVLLIRTELFLCVCNAADKYRHFLNNVLLWMSYERSRKLVAQYTSAELAQMDSLPVPEQKPFDFNVIGAEGQCIVVGRYDGKIIDMIPYEETKAQITQE